MKMMQGAFFLACSNMSRTRLAPTPTNISTKSEPEMVKNGTLASPAMARASSVLPVPGGPTSSTPRGMRPPRRWNLLRVAQELDDLLQVFLGLVDAGDVLEGDAAMRLGQQLRLRLAEAQRLPPAPCICRDRKIQTPIRAMNGSQETRSPTNHGTLSCSGRAVMVTPLP